MSCQRASTPYKSDLLIQGFISCFLNGMKASFCTVTPSLTHAGNRIHAAFSPFTSEATQVRFKSSLIKFAAKPLNLFRNKQEHEILFVQLQCMPRRFIFWVSLNRINNSRQQGRPRFDNRQSLMIIRDKLPSFAPQSLMLVHR